MPSLVNSSIPPFMTETTNSSLPYLLAFQQLGLGFRTLQNLIATFGSYELVWQAKTDDLVTSGASRGLVKILHEHRAGLDPQDLCQATIRPDTVMLGVDDNRYPRLLQETHSPPLVLFVRGNTSLLRSRGLTVVGTRALSRYGEQATRIILDPIAGQGVTIVSGLAFGIDAVAHETALAAKGATLAVLGSGIDLITPVGNYNLGLRILEANGTLISEYRPGTQAQRYHFPQRNRILAGLSPATLVVEAGTTSGALITAKMALEEGREVFAVPGPITNETSAGTNNLIKNGATPVTSPEDLFSALGLDTPAGLRENIEIDTPTEVEAILLTLLRESRHVDELVAMSTLDASVVNATLSLLELRGRVRHLGGMRYMAVQRFGGLAD